MITHLWSKNQTST